MKKILLSLAVLATGAAAEAQEQTFGFNQGDILLEGSIQSSSVKDEVTINNIEASTKETTTLFNPKAGYFINDKFVLGVELGVGATKLTEQLGNVQTVEKGNAFYAGVFGRYYFLDLGQRFKTYTEVGLGMENSKFTDDLGVVTKYSGFNAGLGLGVNYFVTPKIAINFGLSDVLSFSSSKDKQTDGTTNEFNANINVFNNFFSTATFGLTFKL